LREEGDKFSGELANLISALAKKCDDKDDPAPRIALLNECLKIIDPEEGNKLRLYCPNAILLKQLHFTVWSNMSAMERQQVFSK